jgi:hypothetical protein
MKRMAAPQTDPIAAAASRAASYTGVREKPPSSLAAVGLSPRVRAVQTMRAPLRRSAPEGRR